MEKKTDPESFSPTVREKLVAAVENTAQILALQEKMIMQTSEFQKKYKQLSTSIQLKLPAKPASDNKYQLWAKQLINASTDLGKFTRSAKSFREAYDKYEKDSAKLVKILEETYTGNDKEQVLDNLVADGEKLLKISADLGPGMDDLLDILTVIENDLRKEMN